jgi:hypothetical protein
MPSEQAAVPPVSSARHSAPPGVENSTDPVAAAGATVAVTRAAVPYVAVAGRIVTAVSMPPAPAPVVNAQIGDVA